MKISGVGVNKVVNLYKTNSKSSLKNTSNSNKDTIEISTLGKSLSSLSLEENFKNSPEKVEKLKNEISKGTYKVNSALIAKSIIDNIKEKGV
ncbi:flagellar biosynthesis anti-sigma factor FlgM [Clostridium sp. SYSU_GA19001]|uniref:flagellar biosynthesis anti-sigma factor FlgM n=1 Tax=Clostridium caldaquaticum TaxID=2940653 RepID=UPI0020777F54|nr:flagellar biosynthesis anti-sigma factor FlgM [Clostridium caldaquaticum]MCM8710952.1 flagellar biosynthesis anti-sigma factor FlgM [Clostridium caldaquaticum]